MQREVGWLLEKVRDLEERVCELEGFKNEQEYNNKQQPSR